VGGRRGIYKILVGKPEGDRQHGKPWGRWRIILKSILKK
jgi:hypothetical protein